MPRQSAKRRIILHAGFHKTGTKTLQACLDINDYRLMPDWRVETRPHNDALGAVAEAARDYSVTRSAADLAMVSAQTVLWLAALDLAPADGLIASSEDLAGHMPGRSGVKDYGAVANVLHAIIDIAGQLYEGAVEFEVLFTTRAPEPWLCSLYFQQSKHSDLTLDFAPFCAAIPKAADHAAIVAKTRRKLGDVPVHFAALEDLARRRLGPAEAVFDVLGLPDALRATFEPANARNTMPAPGLAEAYVAANRLGLSRDDLKVKKADLARAAVSPAGNLR
jgi:hypothetical protein